MLVSGKCVGRTFDSALAIKGWFGRRRQREDTTKAGNAAGRHEMKESHGRMHQLANGLALRSHASNEEYRNARLRRLRQYSVASISFVVGWSFVICWWELAAANGLTQVAALIFSKLILFGLATFTLRGSSIATCVFLGVCLISVFAILSEIGQEYAYSPGFAILSAIECSAKMAVLISVGRVAHFRAMMRTSGAGESRCRNVRNGR